MVMNLIGPKVAGTSGKAENVKVPFKVVLKSDKNGVVIEYQKHKTREKKERQKQKRTKGARKKKLEKLQVERKSKKVDSKVVEKKVEIETKKIIEKKPEVKVAVKVQDTEKKVEKNETTNPTKSDSGSPVIERRVK